MIVVHISTTGITVDGHAGCAETGKDIICSAVSMLTQNLIKSIETLTDDYIRYQIELGHITIKYKDLSEKSRILIDSFFIGISEVIKAYGEKYVQIC